MNPSHLPFRLTRLCPTNIHALPVATGHDGELWTVDLAIKTEEGMDVEGTASDPNLETACVEAYRRLKRSHTLYRKYGYVPN